MSSSCRIPSDKGPTLAEMSGYAVRNVFNKTGFPEKSGQCDEFRMMPREWRQTGTGQKRPMPPISACVVVCLVLAGGFGSLGQAVAFDGKPAADDAIKVEDLSPREALRTGARQYYAGDKAAALSSLQYAARKGQPMAAWKLGEMYAKGDGVKEDDIKAFEYYSQVVREHGDSGPHEPDAPFVASAFVALGTYYLNGISDAVPQNVARARQIFTHAASYFGDPEAQYELGRMYEGSSSRLAVRWYNLASLKGHVGAQARLGETLYNMAHSDAQKARGLMWLTVARRQVHGTDADWINEMHERYFSLSSENVRKLARGMADNWITQNRPDMVTAQQVPSQ